MSESKIHIKPFVLIIILAMFMPTAAYANSPAPPPYVYFEIINKPENAVYADMLIRISPDYPEYVDFNASNGETFGIAADSPIAEYNADGFMSFTFHYKDSISDMLLEKHDGYSYVYWRSYYANARTVDSYDDSQFRNIEENYNIIKVALLDENGNILQVSDEFDINPKSPRVFMGKVSYNAETMQIETENHVSPWAALFRGLFIATIVMRVLISIFIEFFIAFPFKIKPTWKTLPANAATQIVLLLFMTYSKLPYIQNLIIIEAFVYLSEFGVYTLLYKNISKIRLALYTFTANTASLMIGLLLNYDGAFGR